MDSIAPGMTLLDGSVLSYCRLPETPILTRGDDYRVQDGLFETLIPYKSAFTVGFSAGNFTYSPEDVIQSSIGGWLQYGYKYGHRAESQTQTSELTCP